VTLSVRNLSVRFRQHDGSVLTPLTGVSFDAPPASMTGLVGGSGAGKSLVAEAMLGILPRNAELSGTVTLGGAPPERGKLALAPQSVDALDPLAPLDAQLARFARLAGQPADPAALRRLVHLPEAAGQAWPHQLSGGMARRALLATALATAPKALIADEPTVGLDPATADAIMDLLAALARAGRAVLVISHDLPRLAARAASITVLRDGRMVETAPATAFRDDGACLTDPWTRALWQAQPAVAARAC
jgi:peptide/nickel transport system ATP-binding protein